MNFQSYYQRIFIRNLIKFFLLLAVITFFLFSFYLLTINFGNFKKNLSSKVGVTIYPFYDLVKEIVGDKFEVILITPPGSEPHNFEPSPELIKNLEGVKIIFASGLSIDKWTDNLNFVLGDVHMVYFSSTIDLLKIGNEIDPHFWLSLNNVRKMAEIIKNELINFDSENKNYYQDNYQNVIAKINELQNLAEDTKKEIRLPYLITQHNAFNYLAKDLNLNVIGSLESPNKELTSKELKNLINKIKSMKIKVIFKDSNEESNILKSLAEDMNLKIVDLDPIEGKSGLDYFSAYKKNLETLKTYLK